ncbi:helix-turn-helix transcriptional regulator [Paenibacillus sp. P25]|nr:helix-turn-helix transcriptional regulator [Paenibacillus sp. P25]
MGERRNKITVNPSKEGCPVETTLDVVGGKWKGIILYHLIDGPKRFNEFRRLYPCITQFMLTLQLRELERDGIVHREVYKQVPPKVEYSLTEFGRTLEPIILAMRNWGEAHKTKLDDIRLQAQQGEEAGQLSQK